MKKKIRVDKKSIKEVKNKSLPVDDLNIASDLPGYDEEFQRLQETAIKCQIKNKKSQIWKSLGTIFSTNIAFAIVYSILRFTSIINFLELDANGVNIMNWVLLGVVGMAEINMIIQFIKILLINPQVIDDKTLSHLSLTAREHILDPKGSVLREKYGTSRWTAVTQT